MPAQRQTRVRQVDANLVAEMTAWLRTPSGTMQLHEIQASGLQELLVYRRLFGAARVGAGKTLIAGLAPTVYGAKRPLFVCPASILQETKAHLQQLRKHWRIPPMRVISYHTLSSKKNARLLWDFAPDLLIFDEAHKLKRVRQSACARITSRFIHEHPECHRVILTGTPIRDGFLDYAHLLIWGVGAENAPIPENPDIQAKWAQLLDDEGSKAHDDPWFQADYSILEPWLGGPIHDKETARKSYAEALALTPGVVISADSYQGVGLEINPILVESPPAMEDHWRNLRDNWAMPDDWILLDKAVGVWGASRRYQDGFYYYHDPRPPEDWLAARLEWGRFCRRILEDSTEYDTETRIRDACIAGRLPAHAWRQWDAIRGEFIPKTKTHWLHTDTLDKAARWGREGGIIWTPHAAFGKALSELTGWPYYAQEGKDASGRHIQQATAPTIIASEKSNTDGRNLQKDCGPDGRGYWRNLFTQCPKTALEWEQRVGRTHRQGQTRDVIVDYFVGCLENWRALYVAIEKAQMTKVTLTQELKLLQSGVAVRLPPESWLAGPEFGEK